LLGWSRNCPLWKEKFSVHLPNPQLRDHVLHDEKAFYTFKPKLSEIALGLGLFSHLPLYLTFSSAKIMYRHTRFIIPFEYYLL
jgi:hypothetical protein